MGGREKMEHSAIKEQLFAFYDGELGPAIRQDVESHLSICQECRELYQNWAKTAKVLFPVPKPQHSEFFVHQVMERIYGIEAPQKQLKVRFGLFPRPLVWLVPAFGLAVALLSVMPPLPQEVPMDLLLQSTSSRSSWAFSNHTPTADETLQLVMEG